jgi:hypothetical protein
MKKTFVCIFISLSFFCNAQDKLNIDLEEYLDMYQSKNFEKAEHFIYPEMWNYVDKKAMLDELKSSFLDKKEVKIIVSKPKVYKVSEKYIIENKFYYKINYSNNLKFKFSNKNISISDIISALESAYGEGNVYYDSDLQEFTAIISKIIIARSDNGIDNWKFLVFHGAIEITDLLLPKEIIKKIL